jgi:hypothetical protein
VLIDLGLPSLRGSRNVAKGVAAEGGSREFAGVRGGMHTALTRGNVPRRITANVMPLPYKQGVSSSSLLAPTVIGHLTSSSTGIPFEPAEPVAWLGVPPYHPMTDAYPVWSAVLAA